MAREIFSPHEARSAAGPFFAWVPLPTGGSSGVVAEARRRGVSVTGGHPFSVDGAGDHDGIRVCLGGPESRERLAEGLEILARVLSGRPARGVPAEGPVL